MIAFFRTLAFLILAISIAGCGGGKTSVSGKVTFQGKPVVYGTVLIVGSDGIPKAGAIQPDGTFTVIEVATGPVKIAVTSPPPPGAKAAAKKAVVGGRDSDENRDAPSDTPASPEVIKNWFPIPDKYSYPDTSGLTDTVTSGKSLEIDLK